MTVQPGAPGAMPGPPVTQVPVRAKTPAVPLNVSEFRIRLAVALPGLLIVTTPLSVEPRRATRVSVAGERTKPGVGTNPLAEKLTVRDR